MEKITLKMRGIFEISFLNRFLPATDKEIVTRLIDKEMADLKQLDNKETYKYTEDHLGNAQYCVMSKKHFEMFSRIEKVALDADEEDKVVVKLECLRSEDDPRKWLDYVIHYSLEKRAVPIEGNVFLDVAVYSQHYIVESTHRGILADNLLELYIKKAILDSPEGFYDEIYKKDSPEASDRKDKNLGDRMPFSPLEQLMKSVLLRAIRRLGIPFVINGPDLIMTIANHEDKDFSFYDWLERRAGETFGDDGDSSVPFTNVVIEKLALSSVAEDDDGKKVLLALIGMIRSGAHSISIKYQQKIAAEDQQQWFCRETFNRDIGLVNINGNGVSVTDLKGDMDLDDMLGGVKGQLRYLEIEFGMHEDLNIRAMNFAKGLDKVEMKIISWGDDAILIIKDALAAENIVCIKSLVIVNAGHCLSIPGLLESIVDNEKVESLVLYNCFATLETFLTKHYKPLKSRSRQKLKALGVHGLGNLSNSEIATDGLLSDLKIEMMYTQIAAKNADIGQLMSLVTKKEFKYLVFANLRKEYLAGVVELKTELKRMGFAQWPVIITNNWQMQMECLEPGDYTRLCDTLFELHLNSRE